MTRLDFGAYLSDDRLPLDNVPSQKHPKGKTYHVPSPSVKFTLQLRQMMAVWNEQGADRAPTDEDIKTLLEMTTDADGQPVDFRKKVLGSAYDEMVVDGISAERLQQVTSVVMAYYGMGEHVAQAILASPGEAQARPNRATKRATAKKTAGGRSRQASGASVNPTKRAASRGSSTSRSAPEATRKAV